MFRDLMTKMFSTTTSTKIVQTIPTITTNPTKQVIPLINNSYIINLIGSDSDVEQTAIEIKSIAQSYGLTTKFISIKPYALSTYPTNNPVDWRVNLEQILKASNEHVIINKIGRTNCDEITDLNRSVRALDMFRHPWAFLIDPNVKTRHESVLLNGPDKYQFNCSQINQAWPLLASYDEKVKELESYIKPNKEYI